MCRKACFPARHGVRQYMRAGRPYCLSHGGNVAAERRVKTPGVNGGTPSHRHYARPTPFKTRCLAHFFFASSKKWERCLKGWSRSIGISPAGAGNIAWLRDGVRASPPQKPARGRALLLAGGKFCGSRLRFNSLGRNVRGWIVDPKISNFLRN